MNNVELMLKIFNVKFNEVFEVLDNKNQIIGKYAIKLKSDNDFTLVHYNPLTKQWRINGDDSLATMLLNIIKEVNTIKPLNYTLVNYNEKTAVYVCRPNIREYPMYVEEAKVVNDLMYITYINHNEEKITKALQYYQRRKDTAKFCHFGNNSRKVYEGYSGPLILMNVPEVMKKSLQTIADKYGTIIQ